MLSPQSGLDASEVSWLAWWCGPGSPAGCGRTAASRSSRDLQPVRQPVRSRHSDTQDGMRARCATRHRTWAGADNWQVLASVLRTASQQDRDPIELLARPLRGPDRSWL